MAKKVAGVMWEMLEKAGVKRCYGIVGDALNPVIDAVVDSLALSLPAHVPFHTAQGFTLSMAKQVLSGRLDSVIKTIEHNVRLV